jgi:hypothetical protein
MKKKANVCCSGREQAGLHQGDQVERVQSPGFHQIENRGQDQRASRQQVQRELHGTVFLARASPNRDQQIHGEQRHVVPDEDEKQVEAHEKAENAGDQEEKQREELLDPVFQLPHGQNAREKHDAAQ